jgi:hypothetical protein
MFFNALVVKEHLLTMERSKHFLPGLQLMSLCCPRVEPYLIPIPHPRLEVELQNTKGTMRMITLTTVAGRMNIN